MKIKRFGVSILAVCLAVVFAFEGAAFARETHFYDSYQLPGIDFEEVSKLDYNPDDFDDYLSKLEYNVNIGDMEYSEYYLSLCMEELDKAECMYLLANIDMYKNNSNENINKMSGYMYNFNQKIALLTTTFREMMDNAQNRKLLEEILMKETLESITNNNADYELLERESEILSKYYASDNEQEWRDIFVELVKVRNQIAQSIGYDNYAEYAYSELYVRDYTFEDAQRYSEYVKQYIVPLYIDMVNKAQSLKMRGMELSADEAKAGLSKNIANISSELLDTYNYMEKYHLYDIEYSKDKILPGTGVTFGITAMDSEYLFLSPFSEDENMNWTMRAFTHEFGHFNAGMYRMAQGIYTAGSIDLAEVHSQGLEVLFLPYYDNIYKSEAQTMRLKTLIDMLDSVISGCVFDQWQKLVYTEPELIPERADEIMDEVLTEWGLSNRGNGIKWERVSHNFDSPFYYISYSTSAMAALELYAKSISDYEDAADIYMNLTIADEKEIFRDTLLRCGLGDVFEEDTFKLVSDTVAEEWKGYDDITYLDWYYDAVTAVSGWMEGYEDNCFRPHAQTTREEFVRALSVMYDKMFGINSSLTQQCPFDDVTDPEMMKFTAWANQNGIVNGIGEGEFGGEELITREQMTAFMYRLAALSEDMSEALNYNVLFSDFNQVSDYAQNSVRWSFGLGIIKGYDDGSFKPQNNITRSETAQILRNFSQIIYY